MSREKKKREEELLGRTIVVPVFLEIEVPAEFEGPEALEAAMAYLDEAGLKLDGNSIGHRIIAPAEMEEGGGQ